jgi:hypothetical protein
MLSVTLYLLLYWMLCYAECDVLFIVALNVFMLGVFGTSDSGRHTNSCRYGISYSCKKFYNTGPELFQASSWRQKFKPFQISVTANRNPMYSMFAHVNTSLRTYCSKLIYIANEETNREEERTDENRDRQKK